MTLPIGIQLYTVREQLREDFDSTVRAVAEMGYEGVEFAFDFGDRTPEDLADWLDDLGLKCCGLHAPLADILDPNSDACRYARALGSGYITTSCAREVCTDWSGTIEKILQAAKSAAGQGLTFTYHNHAQEFSQINGRRALDQLFEHPGAGSLKAELDTYWIRRGGEDPAEFLRRFAGRVPQVHLKDMDPEDDSFAEIGEGCLEMNALCLAASQAGAEWLIVEQDVCKRPPLESARISIHNLKTRILKEF